VRNKTDVIPDILDFSFLEKVENGPFVRSRSGAVRLRFDIAARSIGRNPDLLDAEDSGETPNRSRKAIPNIRFESSGLSGSSNN